MATSRSGSKKKYGLGILGGLFALGLIGSFGSHDTDTSPTSSAHSAASSSAAPSAESHSFVARTPQSSTPVAPVPVPVMAMTCPAGGNVASPVFGQQITATAPYTVVIDYGDGDVYTDDDQHLAAIFSHTYHAAGAFPVHAVLTDATGQTADAACSYSWAAPAPAVRSDSGGASSGSGTSSGDGAAAEVPASGGATAVCNDGSLSYSAHRQGTCSGHGGVATWL